MRRGIRAALMLALATLSPAAALRAQEDGEGGRGESVDGYAEWRVGACVIADAQRVCPASGLKFKGEGDARSFAAIPLGYELKAKGKRQRDGSLLAREVEAKPNGKALFEGEVRSATDQAEAQARQSGRFGDTKAPVGKLIESGPRVERVRRIVDNLLPAYVPRESVRVYVIENKEWNAFAMGNYSIYVFTGLLDDMDDDEVAIVLGTRAGARDARALAQAVQEGHVGPARDAGCAGGRLHDRQRHPAGDRRARGARRRVGAQERLRPRHGGPGRPRGPALRLRGGLRHHEGAAAVEPLRQEVR